MFKVMFGVLLAEITLGSWNLKWFPSGVSEHHARPRELEERNVEQAAEVVRLGGGTNRCVLFFQELRDASSTSNLVAKIGGAMRVAVTSDFKTYDNRTDWQQCAIVTDLPVIEAKWQYWQRPAGSVWKRPPRGYAYALLDGGPDGLIACWCVHLKSNYNASTPGRRQANIAKRELSARELVSLARKAKLSRKANLARKANLSHNANLAHKKITKFVIAGDFNTDIYSGEFADENTLPILLAANFHNCFEGTEPSERVTHPGRGPYGDSTLDYLLTKGWRRHSKPVLSPPSPVSDHRMLWQKVGAPGG